MGSYFTRGITLNLFGWNTKHIDPVLAEAALSPGSGPGAAESSSDKIGALFSTLGFADKAAAPAVALKGECPFPAEHFRFARIPAGRFIMGSPADEPGRSAGENRHEVVITKPFDLMIHPVTQTLWQAVMGNNPYYFRGPDLPVVEVSWNEAREFIAKLNAMQAESGCRLPTEAEWEYACRAGGDSRQARYGDLDDIAWCADPGAGVHPVGGKKPNAWGLYDMLGNVWEWCADWRDDYPSGSVTDPQGPAEGSARVVRGGAFGGHPRECRAAARNHVFPGYRSPALGFRLARSVR